MKFQQVDEKFFYVHIESGGYAAPTIRTSSERDMKRVEMRNQARIEIARKWGGNNRYILFEPGDGLKMDAEIRVAYDAIDKELGYDA